LDALNPDESQVRTPGIRLGLVTLHLPKPNRSEVNILAYSFVGEKPNYTLPNVRISNDLDYSKRFLKEVLHQIPLIAEIYALHPQSSASAVSIRVENLKRWLNAMLAEPRFSKQVPNDYTDRWACYLTHTSQSFESQQQTLMSLWNHNIPVIVLVQLRSRNVRDLELIKELLFYVLLSNIVKRLNYSEDLFKLVITFPANTAEDPNLGRITYRPTINYAAFVVDDQSDGLEAAGLLQDLSHRPNVLYSCLCTFVRDSLFDSFVAHLSDRRKWLGFDQTQYPIDMADMMTKRESNVLYVFKYSSYRCLIEQLSKLDEMFQFVVLCMNQSPIAREVARQLDNCNEFWLDTLPFPYCSLCTNRYVRTLRTHALPAQLEIWKLSKEAIDAISSTTIVQRAQLFFDHMYTRIAHNQQVILRRKLTDTIAFLTQIKEHNGHTRISTGKGRRLLFLCFADNVKWPFQKILHFVAFQFLVGNSLVLRDSSPVARTLNVMKLNELQPGWISCVPLLTVKVFEEVVADEIPIGWNCIVTNPDHLDKLELQTTNWCDCWLPKVRQFYCEEPSKLSQVSEH
jgi:hypothetical protein